MPDNTIVLRSGDGGTGNIIEIHRSHDGDFYVSIISVGKDGVRERHQVEFCAPFGGGQHPRTRQALDALVRAMEADNADPELPERYRVNPWDAG